MRWCTVTLCWDGEPTPDGVNTPNLTNLFIKGTNSDDSNRTQQSLSSANGSIKINNQNIPNMNLPANSFSDLEANFNSNLTTLRDSINNKLNADFTDIKNNLDKTCRNINNLTIGSGGGHNHTVNFFSNNFNEFADHSGEQMENNWRKL